jgi:hypothetical protein
VHPLRALGALPGRKKLSKVPRGSFTFEIKRPAPALSASCQFIPLAGCNLPATCRLVADFSRTGFDRCAGVAPFIHGRDITISKRLFNKFSNLGDKRLANRYRKANEFPRYARYFFPWWAFSNSVKPQPQMRPPFDHWNGVALCRDLISRADATVGIQVNVNTDFVAL